MAIALNIIHLGESPFVVQQMQGDVDNTKVPAGTTLGTATQLGAAINDLATTPSGAGVLLPSNATSLGDEIFIYNASSANACKVYPALATENINNAGVGVAYSLTASKSATFTRTQALGWRAVLSS